jgi:hypothetical protein
MRRTMQIAVGSPDWPKLTPTTQKVGCVSRETVNRRDHYRVTVAESRSFLIYRPVMPAANSSHLPANRQRASFVRLIAHDDEGAGSNHLL